MANEKNLLSGNTTMLILKLLESKDMYGYQIIEELEKKSNNTFCLKTGTLYPILHNLENDLMLSSYDENTTNARVRKYYRITDKGRGLLSQKQSEWIIYKKAVNQIIEGGEAYV